jgi:hypothetical protein
MSTVDFTGKLDCGCDATPGQRVRCYAHKDLLWETNGKRETNVLPKPEPPQSFAIKPAQTFGAATAQATAAFDRLSEQLRSLGRSTERFAALVLPNEADDVTEASAPEPLPGQRFISLDDD